MQKKTFEAVTPTRDQPCPFLATAVILRGILLHPQDKYPFVGHYRASQIPKRIPLLKCRTCRLPTLSNAVALITFCEACDLSAFRHHSTFLAKTKKANLLHLSPKQTIHLRRNLSTSNIKKSIGMDWTSQFYPTVWDDLAIGFRGNSKDVLRTSGFRYKCQEPIIPFTSNIFGG